MIPEFHADRRQTARIPTGAKLLHRAVGMHDYELCDVVNVTTSGLELLLPRPLSIGTFVTLLIQPEGSPKEHYHVVGRVERRHPEGGKWLHFMRGSSRRPWSPMFIYDVMYQTLNSVRMRLSSTARKRNGSHQAPAGNSDIRYPAAGNNGDHQLLPGNNGDHISVSMGRKDATVPAHHVSPRTPAPAARDEAVDAGIAEVTVYRALSSLVPFNELNDMIRRAIAHEHEVTTRPAGTVLVERGADDDVAIYLVSGVLQLEGFDERKFYVAADTNCARFPISLLRPHAYHITAATEVAVILLSQDLIRRVIQVIASYRTRRDLGIEVTEQG